MLPEQLFNQFIYYPDLDLIANPHMLDLAFQEVQLTTQDQVTIHGWYLPHDHALATLLFLHGNAGNISHRLDNLRLLHEAGFQILIVDYRGYGQSQGTPSEQGLYLDGVAAWQWMIEETPGPHLIFGRSLGGAVAVRVAVREDISRLHEA